MPERGDQPVRAGAVSSEAISRHPHLSLRASDYLGDDAPAQEPAP